VNKKPRTLAQVKIIVRYCRKQFTTMDGSPRRTIRRIGREKYREIVKELLRALP
jgi:hypothetical protein